MIAEQRGLNRPKFGALLHSDPAIFTNQEDDYSNHNKTSPSPASVSSPRYSNSSTTTSGEASSYPMSPWSQPSPYSKSPWIIPSPIINHNLSNNGLIGSIVREEGHVYSLAASGDLLYTGSDSKNIRVWRNLKEFAGFKSNSGLVKAIVISGDKIFTGHQDGKIRIWKTFPKNPSVHKRIGSLPTFKESIKKSINPKNYVEVRRHRNVLRIKHFDTVSSLSLNAEQGSADGMVKVWRRELEGRGTKHFLVQTLLKRGNAVTALAVNQESAAIYCGSSDGLVNFWEREKHLSHGGVLRGHKMAVLCLATAGNLVFSGSADKSICVWRRREPGGIHTCLSVLTRHGGPVKCLAVEKDQHSDKGDQRWILYSGSLDKSVRVWRVSDTLQS
ncbi:hypothetical protein GH714_041924 [Hevea brasiliensis]|uniref:Uncharacterized protein n=1 Tax=Hevea brasiliensis TaxID=3981 RepID=A0A6A6MWK3_HEVBR|nr:hypothetical protein GH714_041924 [Hevea brasiliensis]